jgi:transglutaminase-like putative cysteine protease
VTRTASEAYQEGRGVCRDYAHLAVAFCRALNIPARYCTGYLSDVGTPPPFSPGDFAAWFEAYLGGQWYTFDARNNVPRIGRVLLARGRDAADVAITTTFGPPLELSGLDGRNSGSAGMTVLLVFEQEVRARIHAAMRRQASSLSPSFPIRPATSRLSRRDTRLIPGLY